MNNNTFLELMNKKRLELVAQTSPHQPANGPEKYSLFNQKQTLKELFIPTPKDCHKGHFGHVLVFEGRPQYLGASRLAALGALKAGAGLVTIAVDTNEMPSAFDHAEFMRLKASEIWDPFLKKISALIIGPGLSHDSLWQEKGLSFLNRLKHHDPLLVVDADGLTILTNQNLELRHKTIIATPHAREAASLLGIAPEGVEQNRFQTLNRLSALPCNKNNHIIWLLKGSNTLIRGLDGQVFMFQGELPVLSAGGMGDVLSGVIAGLFKQVDCALCAALLGVSMQIEAGSILSKSVFKGILASELADIVPSLSMRP